MKLSKKSPWPEEDPFYKNLLHDHNELTRMMVELLDELDYPKKVIKRVKGLNKWVGQQMACHELKHRLKAERKASGAATTLGSKGGKARAEALSPERRAEIARKAAQARWVGGSELLGEIHNE